MTPEYSVMAMFLTIYSALCEQMLQCEPSIIPEHTGQASESAVIFEEHSAHIPGPELETETPQLTH